MSTTADQQLEVALFWGDTALRHALSPIDDALTVGEVNADFTLPASVTGGAFTLVTAGVVTTPPGARAHRGGDSLGPDVTVDARRVTVDIGDFRFELRRVEGAQRAALRPVLRPLVAVAAAVLLFVGAVAIVPPQVSAEPEATLRSFVLVSVAGTPDDLDTPSPSARATPAPPESAPVFDESQPQPPEAAAEAPVRAETSPTARGRATPRRPRRRAAAAAASLGGQPTAGPRATGPTACVNGVCAQLDVLGGLDEPGSARTGRRWQGAMTRRCRSIVEEEQRGQRRSGPPSEVQQVCRAHLGVPESATPAREPEGDGLSRVQVRSVVRAHGSDVRACLSTARLLDPGAQGRVRLRLVVGERGRVLGVDVLDDEAGAGTCLAATIRSWRFPTADGRTRTELPFRFE